MARQPDFLILALPRSRTAWLANFLTTDKTFCYHDPLVMMESYKQVLDLHADRLTGIADTGLGWFDLSLFDCRKLIIERNVEEVNARVKCDMAPLAERLKDVRALRIKFEDINDRLEEIWNYCTGLPYDRLRAEHLKTMNVTVRELSSRINAERLNKLRAEIC